MTVTYREEKITMPLLKEMEPLLLAHWEEVALNKDRIKLKPNASFYIQGSRTGIIHCMTARDDDKLIGYFISIVMPHPHYKDNIFANNDVLYIHEDYRGTSVAYRLFKQAESALERLGVDVITLHMKIHKPFEAFAEKLGYKKVEYTYQKVVER